MTNLSMKQLRYFDALARHGQFGRAADECAVTQPALSVQIKEMEESLGAILVERGTRQTRLTSLGVMFAERTKDILQSVAELEEMARASKGSLGGHFNFGIIPTVAPYLLSNLIREMTKEYPDLDLRPREAKTKRLVSDLLEGHLDAAIVALPIGEERIEESALFSEKFMLLRPEADRNGPVPDATKLKEMRLLLLEEGHCFRDQALAFCSISNTPPRDIMEGSSLGTLVQMVGSGIGVTLIPEMAIAIETRSAAVAVADLPSPAPTRTIGMIWRKSNPLGSQLNQIAQLIRTVGLQAQKGSSPTY